MCTVLLCSDGTLNPNGVRFGSAEIYNIGKNMTDSQVSLSLSLSPAAYIIVLLFFLTYMNM